MSRGMRVLIWLVVGIPVLLIAFFAFAAPRQKDYRFPRVVIDATVRPDGSLDLVEQRTFDFDGEFSFAFFTIEWPVEQIEGFHISEAGRVVDVDLEHESSSQFRARWHFAAEDERRTFRIEYRALCAAEVYADAAHLLWQFVGTGWEKPTDFLQVTVHLPEAARKEVERPTQCPAPAGDVRTRPLVAGEVRAWGHGPLGGEVRILDPQTVRFTVGDLEPATFVEGSILMPPAVVPFAQRVDGPTAASIVREERRLAAKANELRRQHDVETWITWVLLGLVPISMLALVLVARRRDRLPDVPEVLQEPPEEIHPVELAVLWSTVHGRLDPKTAYRAQLLHLVRSGVIEVTPVGRVTEPDDFLVRRVRQAPDLDQAFVGFLFDGAGDGTISMRDVQAKGARRERLTAWWKRVGSRTKRTVTKVVNARSRWELTLAFFVALAAGAYGYWRGIGFGDSSTVLFEGLVGALAAWLMPVALVSFVAAKRFMPPRLSENMRRRVARWGAFRRFLTGFSSLPEAPTLAVVIWEHYLVYAVALGVADEVEEQVRAIVPAERLPEPWPGAPRGDAGYRYYHHSIHSTPAHAASNAAVAVGWSSGWGSSSGGGGGGGGFSGGGGGGGGGTGGGAG